jgi:hypothetical protein
MSGFIAFDDAEKLEEKQDQSWFASDEYKQLVQQAMEERARYCRIIDSQAKKVKHGKDKPYRKKQTTVEMLRFEPGATYLMPHHIITINKRM